jgi:hypothetical protein
MERISTNCKLQGRQPLLITNNCLCVEYFSNCCNCLFEESWDYRQVLIVAYKYVHQDYHLLNHPQYGSLKPNQIPFRSLLLTKHLPAEQAKYDSLLLIEQALAAYNKFNSINPTPLWPSKVLEDFRTIDLSLAQSVLKRLPFTAK